MTSVPAQAPTRLPPNRAPPVQTLPPQPPQQPTPAPTAAPTRPPAPPAGNYIVAATLSFNYHVEYNDCGFGPTEGTVQPYTITLQEATPSDGLIYEGEFVTVYDLDSSFVGTFTLTYPDFTYETPLPGGDSSSTYLTFNSPTDILASRQEYYPTADGECLIDFEQ